MNSRLYKEELMDVVNRHKLYHQEPLMQRIYEARHQLDALERKLKNGATVYPRDGLQSVASDLDMFLMEYIRYQDETKAMGFLE